MTRHLNLLASAPRLAARPPGWPAHTAPLLALLLVVLAGLAAGLNQRTSASLGQQLRAAEQALQVDGPGAARLDAAVIAALRTQVVEREAQADSLQSTARVAGERATAWLDALDAAGGPGVALNQVRVESGARLTIAGSALQASDVHAFLGRLQQHPLGARAAIGQLEIRREEAARGAAPAANPAAPLSFKLSPPAPEATGSAPGNRP